MTVEHQLLREEVMADVDGQLDASRRAAVRAHLDGCAECRALVDEFDAISREMAIDEVEPAPATLADRARVIARRRPQVARVRSAMLVSAAAGVILAAVLIVPRWSSDASRSVVSDLPSAGPGRGGGGRGGGGRGTAAADVAPSSPQGYQGQQGFVASQVPPESVPPLVVRTASISITTDRFETVRGAIETLTRAHDGRIGQIAVTGQPPTPRSLRATLRIPPARLDAALAAIRQLGRVTNESAASDDLTASVRDLRVRIANSRREEQRLVELLARRTGNLKDVLEVERELARVRGEVEQMEAQERAAIGRVDLATVTLEVSETYRADFAPAGTPTGTRMRNAVVDGVSAAGESLVAFVTVFLQLGPTIAVWLMLLAWPARALWRRATIR